MVILVLPVDVSKHQILLFGFFLGLVIDLFSSTIGLHTSAALLIAFLRFFLLKYLAPRDGFNSALVQASAKWDSHGLSHTAASSFLLITFSFLAWKALNSVNLGRFLFAHSPLQLSLYC